MEGLRQSFFFAGNVIKICQILLNYDKLLKIRLNMSLSLYENI
jgi:hypothetical protein